MPIERSTHPFDLAMAFRSEINTPATCRKDLPCEAKKGFDPPPAPAKTSDNLSSGK